MSTTQETQSSEPKTEELNEELNFEKPDFNFVPGTHEWRQRGPYIICYGCELQHAVYIGIENMLIGFDSKGNPIIRNKLIPKK